MLLISKRSNAEEEEEEEEEERSSFLKTIPCIKRLAILLGRQFDNKVWYTKEVKVQPHERIKISKISKFIFKKSDNLNLRQLDKIKLYNVHVNLDTYKYAMHTCSTSNRVISGASEAI